MRKGNGAPPRCKRRGFRACIHYATYGHAVGDQLIRAAAGQIQEAFGEDGTVYRMGGDEFLAMVTGKTAAEMDRFDRILQKRLEGSLTIEHGIPVRAAWGAASTREAPAAELFRLADRRMYEKKRQMKQDAT